MSAALTVLVIMGIAAVGILLAIAFHWADDMDLPQQQRSPERSAWWYLPVILILVFSAYTIVAANDARIEAVETRDSAW